MRFLTDPYGWWVEPFSTNPFMQDALLASLLVVVATSTVGTWVVLRGMSFLGDALAHGVLPGAAVALLLGVNTSVGALVAALAMVVGLGFIRSHSPLPDDASIGVLFVGFLALAVVLLSSSSGAYSGDLNRFLFGSVAGIDDGDLLRQAIVAAVTVAIAIAFHRAFLVMTFDEVQARMLGLRPRAANLVLLTLLAVTIVASFATVGSLLVFGFLIAPPATASLLVRRVPLIMLTSLLLGAAAVFVGLLVSFHQGSAAGATMALGTVLQFLAVIAARAIRTAIFKIKADTAAPPPAAA